MVENAHTDNGVVGSLQVLARLRIPETESCALTAFTLPCLAKEARRNVDGFDARAGTGKHGGEEPRSAADLKAGTARLQLRMANQEPRATFGAQPSGRSVPPPRCTPPGRGSGDRAGLHALHARKPSSRGLPSSRHPIGGSENGA